MNNKVYEKLVDIKDYILSVYNPNNSEIAHVLQEIDTMIDDAIALGRE